jgi:hypothetical protein
MHSNAQYTHSSLKRTIILFGTIGLLCFLTIAFTFPAYAASQATSLASQAVTNAHQGAMVSNSSTEGCPSGDACIYPENKGWNGGHPESNGYYYTYGVHELYGQYGDHYVFNNQTNNALVYLCKNTNGTNCYGPLYAGFYTNFDLTPINSIVLCNSHNRCS